MWSGITKQMLTRYRGSLIAPIITQVLGALIIAAMIMTAGSINESVAVAKRSADLLDVLDSTTVFLGDTVYLSLLIIGVTMHLAMFQQMRDLALLRSLGATPGQVRRCLIRQVAIISIPSAALGFLLAIPAGTLWLAGLKKYADVPTHVSFHISLLALVVVVGIELGASIIGTFIGILRPSRRPPITALVDAEVGNRPASRLRLTIGTFLFLGGLLFSGILSQFQPQQTSDAAVFIILGECIGVGLLAPYILEKVTELVMKLRLNGLAQLAVDDLTTITRSLSGALIPLVLAIAFTTVQIASSTTPAHAGLGGGSSELQFTDFSGTVIFGVFAAVAALNSLITISISRRRNLATIQLAGGSRHAISAMVWAQVAIFAALSLIIGIFIAASTLMPTVHKQFGVWFPYIPPITFVAGLSLVAAIVAAGLILPTNLLTRRRPIEVIATND